MTRILMTFAAVTLATAATAQSSMDVDGDGMLSMAELQAAMPDMTEETFLIVDANADGTVDAEELETAQSTGLIVTP